MEEGGPKPPRLEAVNNMVDTIAATISPKALARQVRKQVSKDRFRFHDLDYDLDLSYISNNLIAMGFPSSGIESLWRNSIHECASMLKKYHDNHFMIWNLSGRTYNYEKFDNQILDFGFPDHHSPPLEMLFKIVLSMHNYLMSDENNVAVVHCMGGKGRTGTVIASYLVYAGIFKDAKEALTFFADKRSSISKGVVQASQLRYTLYFGDIINRRVTLDFRKNLFLTKVVIAPPPLFSRKKKGCRPVIQVYSTHHYPKILLFSSDVGKNQLKFYSVTDSCVEWDINCVVRSDILLVISKFNEGKKKPKKMFRFSFHTAFMKANQIVLTATDLDAQGGAKKFQKWFTNDFTMKIDFALPPKKLVKMQDNLTYDEEVKSYFHKIKVEEEMSSLSEIETQWGGVSDAIRNSLLLAPNQESATDPIKRGRSSTSIESTVTSKDEKKEAEKLMATAHNFDKSPLRKVAREPKRVSIIGASRSREDIPALDSRGSLEAETPSFNMRSSLPEASVRSRDTQRRDIPEQPKPKPTTTQQTQKAPNTKALTLTEELERDIDQLTELSMQARTTDEIPTRAPLKHTMSQFIREVEVIEDYDFLEEIQALLDSEQEEKIRRMEEYQLKQHQMKKKTGKKPKEQDTKITIGKFGLM